MKNETFTNLTDLLSMQSEKIPDAVAIYMQEGSLTYAELDRLIWNTTSFLHKNGVRTADIVILTFKSELAQIITMLALARMGATVLTVSIDTTPLEQKELIQKTKAKITVTDSAKKNVSDLFLNLEIMKEISSPIDKSIYIESPSSPWIIVSGSGSTGKSKLIPITHQQQIERMQLSFHAFPLSEQENFTSLVHTDHYSSKFLILSAFQNGISITLFDRKHTQILDLYDSFNISIVYMPVFYLQQLIKILPAGTKNRMKDLKALLVAGSSVSDPLRKKAAEILSKQLFIGYGTNETGSTVRSIPPGSYTTAGTVGYPLPGFTVEIVDRSDAAVLPGNVGRIRIKGNAMINGYIDDDEATQKAFQKGWFYPGDLGKFTKDGELIHLGREDDMMIMNGVNIYPSEIEQVIMLHPDVIDAIAMPLESSVHQDIPVCAVELSNNSKLTVQELLDFTFEYLGIRAPKKVLIVDTIPRNEQGKLIRKEMIPMMNHQLNTSSQDKAQIKKTLSRKYTQLTQARTIQVHKDLPLSLEHMDEWLSSVLDIKIEALQCSIQNDSSQTQKHCSEVIWRILLLSKTLLQAIRIPLFYTGEILKIDDSHSEHYTIPLLLTHIDHIPKKIYLNALRLSSHLILNFMKRPITDENIQILFQLMQKRFITPHINIAGSGKSTMPILQEAYKNNIPFMHLKYGVYQLGWGSKAKRINRSSTELDSPIGSMMSHNKIMTALLLQEAGLPAAEHKVARSQEEALLSAQDLGWPLVVKPSDMDRGEGVSIDITDNDLLQKAFAVAKDVSKSKKVLIEKQVAGVCCRIFIANQKMLYAVKRLPKSVKGNGKYNVKELIEEANRLEKSLPPWEKSEIFPFDALAIEAIHLAGFTVDSIPQPDELVPLRKIESTQWGGVDEDISDLMHPDNLDLSLRAAKLFGLNVAGIDIITSDISIPWHKNGAIVNEVNYSPQYGGGEISRKTISTYLADMFQKDGRIPVTVIVGGDPKSMDRAKEIQKKQIDKGLHSFISTHEQSISWAGEKIHFVFNSLYKRCRALLLDSRTEALILVVQTDEFLQSGLPLDNIDNLIIDSEILYHDNPSKEKLSQRRSHQLTALLRTVT